MKINMVIVDPDVDRGLRAGRQMAKGLREQFTGWEMHVHIRMPDNTTGPEDGYCRYTG